MRCLLYEAHLALSLQLVRHVEAVDEEEAALHTTPLLVPAIPSHTGKNNHKTRYVRLIIEIKFSTEHNYYISTVYAATFISEPIPDLRRNAHYFTHQD